LAISRVRATGRWWWTHVIFLFFSKVEFVNPRTRYDKTLF
jgi:hypothetical protein